MAKREKKHQLLLGGHMSISKGFANAIALGDSIGCTAIQIFTKSNRQWGAKKITDQEAEAFKQAWKHAGIQKVIAHCTYLINLGASNSDTYKKSKLSLILELERCQKLGLNYLVLHPGSHVGLGESAGITRIAEALEWVLERYEGKTKILIETMAGQGTSIGHTFEQIAAIFDQVGPYKRKLGVCFDTCHVFAAGYDFGPKKAYETVMQEFDKIIGFNKLKVMHINDSKKGLGAWVDRHEDIGKGRLGLEPFTHIFNDERLFDIPKILETPEGTLENYAMNMRIIKTLLTQKTKRMLGVK